MVHRRERWAQGLDAGRESGRLQPEQLGSAPGPRHLAPRLPQRRTDIIPLQAAHLSVGQYPDGGGGLRRRLALRGGLAGRQFDGRFLFDGDVMLDHALDAPSAAGGP